MSQHLRWSAEQLTEHLTKRHGAQAAAAHPTVLALSSQGPSRLSRVLKGEDPRLARSSQARKPAKAEVSKAIKDSAPSNPSPVATHSCEPAPATARCQSGLPSSTLPHPAPREPLSPPLPPLPAMQPAEKGMPLHNRKTSISKAELAELQRGLASTKPKLTQRDRSIASLKASTWTGTHARGEFLEIRFTGTVLLSVNSLYGLSHFQRVGYRKCWHELVEKAVDAIMGPAESRVAFRHFIIRAHRISRRLADTDAKSGYIKYPIDGLRYSNVLVEDTEEHFRDFFCSQSIGQPALVLRIEAVSDTYVPVALRDPWIQGLVSDFAPATPTTPADKKRKPKKAMPKA